MNRSVYSLVLMDDVIRSVNEEAYRRGTSRSNLINQILAEHFSCQTPEMRMQEIFESVGSLVDSVFKVQQQRSSSLMTLRTALGYKYRPTINYKVELERSPHEHIGTLRMMIRTQSSNLIEMFNAFLIRRIRFESALLESRGVQSYSCKLTDGCFTRALLNSGLNENDTAEAISMYLNNLNDSIQAYFSGHEQFTAQIAALENKYKKMLDRYII